MLDKFLEVSYRADRTKVASRQLIDKLKELPLEELMSYVNGDENSKLASLEACGQGGSVGRECTWLDKYKETPLFAKAVELEKALLQLDMEEQQQREAERAARPAPSDVWAKRDAINLQKRMLDLDLVMAQAGATQPEAPEAKEEQAIGELEQAQAQEMAEGGGGDAAHEQQEDAAIQQLQAAHGGAEGAPQQQQPPQPPKPKAPPQQAQGGGEDGEEEGPPKKDEKPKGMSVEVKQSAARMASAAVDVGRFLAKTAAAACSTPDAEASKVRAAVAKKYPGLSKEGSGPEGHHLRRALLGNPVSSAIEAKPGSRIDAWGEATGHSAAETLKGGLKGTALGAGLGAAGGLGLALLNKGQPAKALGYGAGMGAYAGGLLGSTYGGIKGHHGAEASRIHGARSAEKTAGVMGALKPLATQAAGALGAGKSLAQTAYKSGGVGQVASSFGNVAKNFAQKNPLAAAGIAGAGGMLAGKALSN